LAGAEEAAEEGINIFDENEWDVLEDIPNDSAAALILLEHHWAVPLRDAIARAGGFRLSDGFISPLDLVAVGLVTAEEANELHARETANAAAPCPRRRRHSQPSRSGGTQCSEPAEFPAARRGARPAASPGAAKGYLPPPGPPRRYRIPETTVAGQAMT